MSKPDDFDNEDPQVPPPLDLSKWRSLPMKLMIGGIGLAIVGVVVAACSRVARTWSSSSATRTSWRSCSA